MANFAMTKEESLEVAHEFFLIGLLFVMTIIFSACICNRQLHKDICTDDDNNENKTACSSCDSDDHNIVRA